jgi:hypothetical protein
MVTLAMSTERAIRGVAARPTHDHDAVLAGLTDGLGAS